VELALLGRTASAGKTGAEIGAFHAKSKLAFVTNAAENALDVYDLSNQAAPPLEGIDTGRVGHRTYAFVAAERHGRLYAYDLSADRNGAAFAGYVNTREADLGPEGVRFVSAKESPTKHPLVLVTHEISGTLTVFEVLPG
jgi:hypothetical protein